MRHLVALVRLAPAAVPVAARAAALASARSLLALLDPLLLMIVVDAAHRGRRTAVLAAGAALLGSRVVQGRSGIVAREWSVYAGQRLTLALRARLLRHLQRFSPGVLTDAPVSSGTWLLTGELNAVEIIFSDVFIRLTSVAIGVVGTVVALALVDARVAGLSLLVALAVSLAARRSLPDAAAAAATARAARADLASEIEERLSAAEAAQLARRERLDAALIHRAAIRSVRAEVAMARAQGRSWGIAEGLAALTQAAAVTAGGLLVTNQLASVGALLAVYLYVAQLLQAVPMLAQMLGRIQSSLASAERLVRFLSTDPPTSRGARRDRSAVLQDGQGSARLALEEVGFQYPSGHRVLDGISLVLEPGEHVALMGPSGCGKSTLIRLLARFADPTQGRIRLGAADLRDLDVAVLRRLVAVLPQSPQVVRGSLDDNIRFSPESRMADARWAAEQAAIDPAWLPVLDLYVVGSRGSALSGGERQRVALARLFVEDPALLVLDEPTAALDQDTAQRVVAAVQRFADGRALLVSTHDWRVARQFPRVLVLEHGRIVGDGAPADVLRLLAERRDAAPHVRAPMTSAWRLPHEDRVG